MKEIVGAMVGTIITNDRRIIYEAVKQGTVKQFLDRKHMQFMAAMDLGQSWEEMANGPTLFCVDDDGNPQPPNMQQKETK